MEEKKPLLCILRGLPNIGKSVWIQNQKPHRYIVIPVSRNSYIKLENDKYNFDKIKSKIKEALNEKNETVYLNSFIETESDLLEYVLLAYSLNANVKIIDFMSSYKISLEIAKYLNKLNPEKQIDEDLLEKMYENLIIPLKDERLTSIIEPAMSEETNE